MIPICRAGECYSLRLGKRFSLMISAWLLFACSTTAGPIDLFLARAQRGQIGLVYFDPADTRNPNASLVALGQFTDSTGKIGSISVHSPGFMRLFGKGFTVAGNTVIGGLAGAAAGAAIGGLGAGPGAIIGGVGGFSVGVGEAIDRNTVRSNPFACLDIAIFDQLTIKRRSGTDVDLLQSIVRTVGNGQTQHALPGGGYLLRPAPSLFDTSYIRNADGTPAPSVEVIMVSSTPTEIYRPQQTD